MIWHLIKCTIMSLSCQHLDSWRKTMSPCFVLIWQKMFISPFKEFKERWLVEKQVNIQTEEWEGWGKHQCFSRLSENHKLNAFLHRKKSENKIKFFKTKRKQKKLLKSKKKSLCMCTKQNILNTFKQKYLKQY